jgi:transcriptional regulator with PAS, ATPase and Fis domain
VADTGTIFLDEIGTLNLDMQKKFLRIIQEKILVRIGEAKERSIDIRIITATNSDLEKMVTAGKFRKDLYFRLKHFEIFISPLKNRNEDVKELIDFFLNRYNEKYKEKKTISEIGLEKLLQYDYPGNIRELENILEQAYIISDTKIISKNDLIFTNLAEEDSDNTMDMNLRKMEKQLVIRALKITGGNLSKAAKILGINRNQLAYKLEKYN